MEIAGNATGFVVDGPKGQELEFSPTSLFLALKNGNSESAMPPSLLNLFSNPANYMILGGQTFTVPGGQEAMLQNPAAVLDPRTRVVARLRGHDRGSGDPISRCRPRR